MSRIDEIDAAREYIDAIDFSGVIANLTTREGGRMWPLEKARAIEVEYRRWLFLRRKHEHVHLLPPWVPVDRFWHEHILDTRAYFRDTACIFGYYHHHFPYFGTRGETDAEALRTAGRVTWRLYREEYGERPSKWVWDS